MGDNQDGQCDVANWRDIVAIAAGAGHTVGLKKNGVVIVTGFNMCGECSVEDWHDVVTIAAGDHQTVGIRPDGTVMAVGDNQHGQCDVANWHDIVTIAAGDDHTVGLKIDGTVVATGDNRSDQCDVENWRDIVAIAAGDDHTVGLRSDGTLVAIGWNLFGQDDVSDWKLFYTEEDLAVIKKEKEEAEKQRMDELYEEARQFAKVNISRAQIDAAEKFAEISGWRDADEQAELCRQVAERLARQEKERAEQEHRQQQWRIAGRCQHCGGEFKGLFTKKCVQCHREKDY